MRGTTLVVISLLILAGSISFLSEPELTSADPVYRKEANDRDPPSRGIRYGKLTNVSFADASFYGESDDDPIHYINSVGDINKDGYGDFLVCSLWGADRYGKAYLFLGKETGWKMDMNISTADASFIGENMNDRIHLPVTNNIGDVNGDGYGDFLLFSPFNSDVAKNSGKIFLLLGKPTGWKRNTSLYDADASFVGEVEYGNPWEVSILKDINGDGYDELMIGCASYGYGKEPDYLRGKVYLFFGKQDGWEKNVSLSEADVSFLGEECGDRCGTHVSYAGDVNGDGYGDFMVSARQDNYPDPPGKGKAYLFFGGEKTWGQNINISTADVMFYGEENGDEVTYVHNVGDINDDGLDDICITSVGNSEGGLNTSQVYIFFGKKGGWTSDIQLSNADASYHGAQIEDHVRPSGGAGDIDGDGIDDLYFASSIYWYNTLTYSPKGTVFIVLGRKDNWEMDMDLSDADHIIHGEYDGDKLGHGCYLLKDINGDGMDDIAAGSWFNSEHGTERGQIYILFPFKNDPPLSIESMGVYSDDTYSSRIDYIGMDEEVFIQVTGADGNSSSVDFEYVQLFSNETDPDGIELTLIETGKNTGVYRGTALIGGHTSREDKVISASVEEGIGIRSDTHSAEVCYITLTDPLNIIDIDDKRINEKDHFEQSVIWYGHNEAQLCVFDTNASFLSWELSNRTMWGRPSYQEVGEYFSCINITDGQGYHTELNFTITVRNIPPRILTVPVTSATEETEYYLDIQCTEEDSPIGSYSLNSGPMWLNLDQGTGVLNGTPENSDVGSFNVNVSFDDGNGGIAYLGFQLIVGDVNDAPVLNVTPRVDVDQDSEFIMFFSALDIDLTGDELVYNVHTNADWLVFDKDEKRLVGTPDRYEVGDYFVNISVSDPRGGLDFRNFTFTVNNINDPPQWLGEESLNLALIAGTEHLISILEDITDIDNRTEDLIITTDKGTVVFDGSVLRILYPNKTTEMKDIVAVNISDGEYTTRFYLWLDIQPAWKVENVSIKWDKDGSLNVSATGVKDMDLWLIVEGAGSYQLTANGTSYSLIIPSTQFERDTDYYYYFSDSEGGGDLSWGAHNGTIVSPKGTTNGGGSSFLIIIVILIVLIVIGIVGVLFFLMKRKGPVEGKEEEEKFGVGVERGEVKGGTLDLGRPNR